ncbi:YlbF family regulator [Tessaracoccus sp. G1721]
MLSTQLRSAAEAFGQALRHAPAVASYMAATDALADDHKAQQILVALQGPQAAYVAAQRAGSVPTQEQVEDLRAAQAAVRGSDVIMNHLRASNAVKAFLPTAASEVGAGLGADYAGMISPASGGC